MAPESSTRKEHFFDGLELLKEWQLLLDDNTERRYSHQKEIEQLENDSAQIRDTPSQFLSEQQQLALQFNHDLILELQQRVGYTQIIQEELLSSFNEVIFPSLPADTQQTVQAERGTLPPETKARKAQNHIEQQLAEMQRLEDNHRQAWEQQFAAGIVSASPDLRELLQGPRDSTT